MYLVMISAFTIDDVKITQVIKHYYQTKASHIENT